MSSVAKELKHRLQARVRAYFGFSRTETNAFLILLPLIALALLSEPAYRHWRISRPIDFSKDIRELDSIIAQLQWLKPDSLPEAAPFTSFNPNTASQEELKRLGLNQSLAARLVRYREKGGVFRKKEDLLKIYGFDSAWFRQARKWISIPRPEGSKPSTQKLKIQAKTDPIDINLADSIQLVNVYGIGPALSKRIRSYRDRLGGFVAMEQLHEVYGLDSAVVRKLREKFFVDRNFQPRKINLNTVTLETFRHPYVKWTEARAILAYRLQHERFQSINQLSEIQILSSLWMEKMRPYLAVD